MHDFHKMNEASDAIIKEAMNNINANNTNQNINANETSTNQTEDKQEAPEKQNEGLMHQASLVMERAKHMAATIEVNLSISLLVF